MEAQVATKSEFASMIGVTPGRVSQYISEGKLGPVHMEGVGRAAKIRVVDALAALKLKLDPGQRMGNGLDTKLDFAMPSPVAPPASDIDQKFKQAKLEQQEAINRKLLEEERLREGVYMLTSDARAEMARLAGQVLQSLEGAMGDMAQVLSAQYQLPQRDVVHFMRQQFREKRAKISAMLEREATTLPAQTEDTTGQD